MNINFMNLFEMFDPMISMNYYSNFISNWMFIYFPIMFYMILFNNYYVILNWINILFIKFIKLLYKEFNMIYKYSSNIIVFMNLLMYIFIINFLGLIPYVFTPTSHLLFNLMLSLSLWMALILYVMINMYKLFFIHLVPLNSPLYLMNFMVIIELISNIIRPLTLSIRLCANLISGHLILTLLGNFILNFLNLIFISFWIQNMLMILEIFMSFIQAYVFSMLMILYYSEY